MKLDVVVSYQICDDGDADDYGDAGDALKNKIVECLMIIMETIQM